MSIRWFERTICGGNVLGCRNALESGCVSPRLNLSRREALGPFSEDETRGDSVDADVRAACLRHVLCEVDTAGLGDGCRKVSTRAHKERRRTVSLRQSAYTRHRPVGTVTHHATSSGSETSNTSRDDEASLVLLKLFLKVLHEPQVGHDVRLVAPHPIVIRDGTC